MLLLSPTDYHSCRGDLYHQFWTIWAPAKHHSCHEDLHPQFWTNYAPAKPHWLSFLPRGSTPSILNELNLYPQFWTN